MSTRRIEVFRPGTFVPMQGTPVTMTAADLKAIAAAYDAEGSPTPIVVGHPRTEDAAYGWAKAFSYDEGTERLVAECDQIPAEFSEQVAAGRYKRISLALFSPDAPNNPKPGSWYPKHIGFLGAAAPAVSGLKPVTFGGDDAGVLTIEFADPGLKEVASLFQRLRDRMIEREGLETADQVLPGWSIRWLDDLANDPPRQPIPSFTEPSPKPEPRMNTPNPTLDAREQEIRRREEELNRRARETARADHVAFAEGLIKEGRLIPASRDKVVGLLDALADPAAEPAVVAFSEGGATVSRSAAEAVREILSAQPKVVTFGEMDTGRGGQPATVAFAAPDGRGVDKAGLETLAKVEQYRAKHPEVSFADAVAAVSRG